MKKKKMEELQEILFDLVVEMRVYGSFMSQDRADELIKRIKNLSTKTKNRKDTEG